MYKKLYYFEFSLYVFKYIKCQYFKQVNIKTKINIISENQKNFDIKPGFVFTPYSSSDLQ